MQQQCNSYTDFVLCTCNMLHVTRPSYVVAMWKFSIFKMVFFLFYDDCRAARRETRRSLNLGKRCTTGTKKASCLSPSTCAIEFIPTYVLCIIWKRKRLNRTRVKTMVERQTRRGRCQTALPINIII